MRLQHTCSMKVQASRSVSAIFRRTMTTERRRRQKDDVDSFSSKTRLFLVEMTPMLYSLLAHIKRTANSMRGE